MTVVALILTPVILLYQGWTYYVFRARVTGEECGHPPTSSPSRRALRLSFKRIHGEANEEMGTCE